MFNKRPVYAALNEHDFRKLVRGDEVIKIDRHSNREIHLILSDIGYFVMDKIISESIADFQDKQLQRHGRNPFRDKKDD